MTFPKGFRYSSDDRWPTNKKVQEFYTSAELFPPQQSSEGIRGERVEAVQVVHLFQWPWPAVPKAGFCLGGDGRQDMMLLPSLPAFPVYRIQESQCSDACPHIIRRCSRSPHQVSFLSLTQPSRWTIQLIATRTLEKLPWPAQALDLKERLLNNAL